MYHLFIGENCHECQYVIENLNRLNVDYVLFNIDKTEVKPPIKIFTLPAIFKENELLAYGSDIISFVKNKSS